MGLIVTGASGFLGNALMRSCAQMGLSVQGVSRRPSPGLLKVSDYKEAPVGDVLVHLAEASDRAYTQAHAPRYEQQALANLATLLEKGFSRVVYASSAVLYGDQEETPRKVGDLVYEVDAYTRLKLASERLVLAHGGVVARLTNLYGQGMAEGNVLSAILKQLPNAGPVRVFDSTPVRDFLWVEDAARALALMATSRAKGIFNVGSGEGVSIYELACVILNAAGQQGRAIESTHSGNGCSRLVLDPTQTETTFGWRPVVTLIDGIATLVSKEFTKGMA